MLIPGSESYLSVCDTVQRVDNHCTSLAVCTTAFSCWPETTTKVARGAANATLFRLQITDILNDLLLEILLRLLMLELPAECVSK